MSSPPPASYQQQISQGLENAYRQSLANPASQRTIDIRQPNSKFIIFSDQHRGGRNGADDFMRSERAYNAALGYYYHQGHTLVTLGDVEELWEERIPTVLQAYPHTFWLESRFNADGRYIRLWGNHDDDWQYPEQVQQHLDPLYTKEGGEPLQVHEGVLLHVRDGEKELGAIFLAHGHQGTLESDRIAPLSKFVVRHVWRPFQRLTNYKSTTAASSWSLRERHNVAMYRWAASKSCVVLITGHTHRPVFESKTHADGVLAELTAVLAHLQTDPTNPDLRLRASELNAELEWIRAQNQQPPGHEGNGAHHQPAYFNTGCCCYDDGDITGIEISGNQIRLVRFPNAGRKPVPHVLAQAQLTAVFSACTQPLPEGANEA
jgi:predicted phosphodiesterase